MLDITLQRTSRFKERYTVYQDEKPIGLLSRSGNAWIFDCRLDKSLSKSPDPVMAVAKKLVQLQISSSPAGAGNK